MIGSYSSVVEYCLHLSRTRLEQSWGFFHDTGQKSELLDLIHVEVYKRMHKGKTITTKNH